MLSLTAMCFFLASSTVAGDDRLVRMESFAELLKLAVPECTQTDAILPTSLRVRGRAGVGRLRQQVQTQQECRGGSDEPAPTWRAGSFVRLTVAEELAVGFSGEVLAEFLNDWPGYVVLDTDSAFKIEDHTYYRQLDLIYDGPDLQLDTQDLSLSFDLFYASRIIAPLVVTMATYLAIDTLETPHQDGSSTIEVLSVPIASQNLTLDPLYLRRNLSGRQVLRERPIIVRQLP